MTYEEKKFNIPELKGLSAKQLEEHLKLYAGYVKHANLIREKIGELEQQGKEKNAYLIAELRRRFGFEFDGMRMHEYYFEEFEGGGTEASTAPSLNKVLEEQYNSFEGWLDGFKKTGMTRGIGWAILYYDDKIKGLHNVWVGDHELGQLAGLPIIIAMDMWEHAYMIDYAPSEKKEYIEAFFKNLNWNVVEKRFTNASKH